MKQYRLFVIRTACLLALLVLYGCSNKRGTEEVIPTLKYHSYYKLVINVYSDYDNNVTTDTIYSSRGKSEVVVEIIENHRGNKYYFYCIQSLIDHSKIYKSHNHQKIEIVSQAPISKEEFEKL